MCRETSYPDVEVEVLVGDRLDIEPYGGYSGDDFTNLEHDACQLLTMNVMGRDLVACLGAL